VRDRARWFFLGLLILGALAAACGTPTPSAPSLKTKGGPPQTPTPPPSSTAAAVGWASLNCGRLDHATCLSVVTMVENYAPTKLGPTTSVVADYSCPPGARCAQGFGALVVLIPEGETSGPHLAIFYVYGLSGPETVAPYPYSLPQFMQWVQESGVVATVVVSGGPAPGNLAGPGPVDLTITAAGKVVVSQTSQSGTAFRIALPPGEYEISGLDGNAPCISGTVDVAAGGFTAVTVTCSIR
jgi:hypothetical protein